MHTQHVIKTSHPLSLYTHTCPPGGTTISLILCLYLFILKARRDKAQQSLCKNGFCFAGTLIRHIWFYLSCGALRCNNGFILVEKNTKHVFEVMAQEVPGPQNTTSVCSASRSVHQSIVAQHRPATIQVRTRGCARGDFYLHSMSYKYIPTFHRGKHAEMFGFLLSLCTHRLK